MIFELESRHIVKVSGVERASLDKLVASHPMPEAPTKEIPVWGDLIENLPDYDDLEYRRELVKYYWHLGRDQTQTILSAIEVVSDKRAAQLAIQRATELTAVNLGIAHLMTSDELSTISEEVFYQSTVTQRGIEEAAKHLSVKWLNKDVLTYRLPDNGSLTVAPLYRDRIAAAASGYTWREFCRLTGPEQSAEVAFYLAQNTLAWLRRHL